MYLLTRNMKLAMPLCIAVFFSCSKSNDALPIAANAVSNNSTLLAGLTVVQLRSTPVVTNTKYVTTDYGGGTWKYDSLDTKSDDNTGTVLVTKSGQRLKRVISGALNALWFGLTGNGSDETAIIQAAINASAGQTLQIPAGTYFTRQLNLVSNLRLTGVNAKLRMIQGPLDNVMINLYDLANVEISGLEIALNGIEGSIWDGTSAIELQNCTNIHIDNCFIHDNTYVGIRLIGGNNNVRINNNTIQNTDTGVHANNTNTNINIIRNIIEQGTSEGITIYGYTQLNCPSHFLIDSNIILNKQAFGINIPFAKFGTITHNTISNCYGGITLHDVVSVGSEGFYTSDINIAHNVVNNATFGIIYVGDRTVVDNNLISTIQQDGINANNFNDTNVISTGVVISNNTVTSPALAGGGRGGISVKNLASSNITGNTISNCSNSFSIRFNGNCNNLGITGNNCKDGMLQSTNTIYNTSISISNNILANTYFPVAYPLTYQFKMVAQGNTYTSDTSFNTAPDNYGSYGGINSFCVRTNYYLAAGTIGNIIPSWTGRVIVLASTNTFTIQQGNNLQLKGSVTTTVPKNKSLTMQFNGNLWAEVSRTF